MLIFGNQKNEENNFQCKYHSNYDKYLLSEKYKKNICGEPNKTTHICYQCNKEYLNYNALWKHKKTCVILNKTRENLQNKVVKHLVKETYIDKASNMIL